MDSMNGDAEILEERRQSTDRCYGVREDESTGFRVVEQKPV